ncbi:TIGR04222 domain-containing membrane protein [Streptomyces scabiei]
MYDLAFLAGGVQRVADSAVIALSETGSLRMRGSRVRAVGEARPEHPVERAVIAWCTRSRSIASVSTALRTSPEAEEAAGRTRPGDGDSPASDPSGQTATAVGPTRRKPARVRPRRPRNALSRPGPTRRPHRASPAVGPRPHPDPHGQGPGPRLRPRHHRLHPGLGRGVQLRGWGWGWRGWRLRLRQRTPAEPEGLLLPAA